MLLPIEKKPAPSGWFNKRLLDLALYVIVAAILGAAVTTSAILGVAEVVFVKWVGLVLSGVAPFYYFTAGSRRLWRKSAFWVLVICFLVAHVILFCWVFSVIQWRPIWLLLSLGEVAVMLICRRMLWPK